MDLSSKSPQESVDVEKTMKNLKLKEEKSQESVTGSAAAASSSSSLTSKQDLKEMKDLKNQETGQSSKFEGKEGESVLVLGTHKAGVGSSFVGEEDSSKGKNKKPKSLVSLRSSEGDTFELEESSAMLSQTIKHMIEEDGGDHVISLTNISSEILERVVVFLEKHGEIKERDELVEWDKKFIEDLKKGDLEVLFGLIVAADYLNAKCLLDVTCQVVADMIKGKTPEEIRKFFNIKNVVTPEEEEAAAVRAENAWAFE